MSDSNTLHEFWKEVAEIADLHQRKEFIKKLEEAMTKERKAVETLIVEQEMRETDEEWTAGDDQGYHHD